MAHKEMQGGPKGGQKASAAERILSPPAGKRGKKGSTKAFQQQDQARRLGDFEGTGSHARTGNRGHQ